MTSAWKNTRSVSLLKAPIHHLKEYLHRRPHSHFDWTFATQDTRLELGAAAAKLRETGIVILDRHFQGEALRRLQSVFSGLFDQPTNYNEADLDTELNQDFLHRDPVFLEAALDERLLEIIASYYGKPFALGRADAHRLYKTAPARRTSYRWHHDARGRQLKAIIYLTDVTPDGQRMSYLAGSHKTYHSYFRSRGEGTCFEDDFLRHPEWRERVVEFVGAAGTVAIFDTNGLHSGNRAPTQIRENLTFYYPTNANYKQQHVLQGQLQNLTALKQKIVLNNPKTRIIETPLGTS